MPRIQHPSSVFTVIVSVDAEVHVMPDLEQHAQAGLQLFRNFDGFVAGALHRSTDGTRLIQYLQWEDESQYERCINDAVWDSFPSTKTFFELIAEGKAHVDARAFDVVTTS